MFLVDFNSCYDLMQKIDTYLDTCTDGLFNIFIIPLYLSCFSSNSYVFALMGTDLKGYACLYPRLFGI